MDWRFSHHHLATNRFWGGVNGFISFSLFLISLNHRRSLYHYTSAQPLSIRMPPPIDDTRHQSAVNDNIELRSSLDEDSYPLQDHDPMSSERLLSTDDDRPTKTQQKLSPHKKALLKSSAINLFWITSW